MASKTVSFRLPDSLIKAIEARTQSTGKRKTTLIIEALAQVYDLPPPSTPSTTPETIQQQLDKLKHQIAALQVSQSYPKAERVIEHPIRLIDSILSLVLDPIFVCDRRGRFTYINPAGAQMWQIERSQLLGKTLGEIELPPNFIACFSPQLEAVLTHETPISGEFCISRLRQTRHYEYVLTPMPKADSAFEGIVGIARETTEIKRLAAELRDWQERCRTLFELTDDFIFFLDASTHTILEVNPKVARRLGYTYRELSQLSVLDISSPAVTAHYEQNIMSELTRTGRSSFKHILRHKNGTEIPVQMNSQLIEYRDRLVFQCCAQSIPSHNCISTPANHCK